MKTLLFKIGNFFDKYLKWHSCKTLGMEYVNIVVLDVYKIVKEIGLRWNKWKRI